MPRGHSTQHFTAGQLWRTYGGDNAQFVRKVSKRGRQYICLDVDSSATFTAASKRGAVLGLAVAHELRAALNVQVAMSRERETFAQCQTDAEANYVRAELARLDTELKAHRQKADAYQRELEGM